MATGLSYLPVTVAIAVSSLVLSGRLAERYGAARVLVGGLVLFVGGLLLLARTPVGGTFWTDVAPAFVIMGAGFGLAMPQVTSLAMAAAPSEHSGAASGFVTTTQQVGGVIGLGVVSVVADGAGLGAGLLVAAAVLAGGTTLAATLLRTGPGAGRVPDAQPAGPTLERC
jgi:MFS family permease